MTAEVARKADGAISGRKRRPVGRPKGLRISVRQSEQITAICTRLGLPDTLLTFRDVSAALTLRAGFPVSLGTVHRYAKGEYPQRPELRALFRLPPVVTVTACACGKVHLRTGRCPNAPRPPDLAKFTAAIDWLAGRECLTPPAVRVYGRRGKAVTW